MYGNCTYRLPFPKLQRGPLPAEDLDPQQWGATSVRTCSLSGGPFSERGVRQAWISLRVATDVLPLLVNACSDACIEQFPPGADDYIPQPHGGGRSAVQSAPRDA